MSRVEFRQSHEDEDGDADDVAGLHEHDEGQVQEGRQLESLEEAVPRGPEEGQQFRRRVGEDQHPDPCHLLKVVGVNRNEPKWAKLRPRLDRCFKAA